MNNSLNSDDESGSSHLTEADEDKDNESESQESSNDRACYSAGHSRPSIVEEPWCCPLCQFRTTGVKKLRRHVLQNHDETSMLCTVCTQMFGTRNELNSHCRDVHKMIVFQCDKCSKTFKSQPGLRNHRDVHGQKRECPHPHCGFQTTTRRNLKVHEKKYHESGGGTVEQPSWRHTCSGCSASFMFKSLLNRHFEAKHLKIKPFKCQYCDHRSTERAALLTHVRCVHTGEKPFACSQCGVRFSTQSILKRHQKVHTGERPYMCDVCGAAFPEKRDLKVHRYKVHDKVRPFHCGLCSASFYRKDNMYSHRRVVHKWRT